MGKQVVARFYGGVAQLGEHLPCKQGVMSSNLTVSIQFFTELICRIAVRFLFLENFIQRDN